MRTDYISYRNNSVHINCEEKTSRIWNAVSTTAAPKKKKEY